MNKERIMTNHEHRKQLIIEVLMVYPALDIEKLKDPRMGVKRLRHILDAGFDGSYNLHYAYFL
jgi:CHAD domain-containing protein